MGGISKRSARDSSILTSAFLLFRPDGRLRRRHHRRRGAEDRTRRWSPSRELGEEPTEKDAVESVFVSANATVVRAHVGSTAVLDCRVRKDSQYGMVRSANDDDEDGDDGEPLFCLRHNLFI